MGCAVAERDEWIWNELWPKEFAELETERFTQVCHSASSVLYHYKYIYIHIYILVKIHIIYIYILYNYKQKKHDIAGTIQCTRPTLWPKTICSNLHCRVQNLIGTCSCWDNSLLIAGNPPEMASIFWIIIQYPLPHSWISMNFWYETMAPSIDYPLVMSK